MGNSISDIGLVLCAIPAFMHGPEAIAPTFARHIANFVLPLCGFTLPAPTREQLTYDDQMSMLNAAIAKFPDKKSVAAKDLLFIMLFESRQGAAGFISACAASFYASALPLEQRHPIHFLFGVLSVVMALANANHIGLPFGFHPLITKNGWWVGALFVPFWIVAAFANFQAMNLSLKAL